ncbi:MULTISPECIES: hypothetical protein [unclassified Rhizobium]
MLDITVETKSGATKYIALGGGLFLLIAASVLVPMFVFVYYFGVTPLF